MNATYNTKQKMLIEDFLRKNSNQQYTCEEISDSLKEQGTPVGKTTVYRYTEKLLSEGKIRKIVDEKSKSALFQFIDESMNCHEHMHLRCLKCGAFIHLDCSIMSQAAMHILNHHKFRVDNSKTILYGLCDKCSE